MIWKPLNFIRHLPHVLWHSYLPALRQYHAVLQAIMTWGRFLTWNIIKLLFPHRALFMYFWITAPYYQSPINIAQLKRRPGGWSHIGTYHSATILLTDVIHPNPSSPF